MAPVAQMGPPQRLDMEEEVHSAQPAERNVSA